MHLNAENLVLKKKLWLLEKPHQGKSLGEPCLLKNNLVMKRKKCKLLMTWAAYTIVCLVKSISACGEGDLGQMI